METLNDKRRVFTAKQAKEKGLLSADYDYKNIPDEFIGTLEFKVWGKASNLRLFFRSEEGHKYVLSVFHQSYAPKKMPAFDMSKNDIQAGMKFLIRTELNRNKNISVLEAHAL